MPIIKLAYNTTLIAFSCYCRISSTLVQMNKNQPQVELDFVPTNDFEWLEWYVVKMNNEIIGSIGRNKNVETYYHFSAHNGTHYGSLVTNQKYSGNHKTLEKAKLAALYYAEFLNKK